MSKKKSRPYAHHFPLAPLVLPAVYDDVLSYEEWLSKVIYQLNELQAYVDEQLADVDKLVEDKVNAMSKELKLYIDNSIKAVNIALDSLDDRLNAQDRKIDAETARLMAYIDAKAREIEEKILALQIQFEAKIYDFWLLNKRYTDDKCNRERIERRADIKLINDRLDQLQKEFPLVYCPPKGRYETVQEAIVDVWDSLRYFGLTAQDYDHFEFSAQDYADLLLTAFEYDVYGAYILKDQLREMFNPFTGKFENVRDVVTYIANMLKWNGKTASEYDGYQYSAEDFDGSTYTAYPQDTSKYWTRPEVDYKNRFYKSYMKVYELADDATSQPAFTFTFDSERFKGISLTVAPAIGAPAEILTFDKLGSFAVSNNSGVRTVTLTEASGTITCAVSDNVVDDTTTPATTDNEANIIVEAFRRGSAYDVTELSY